MTTTLQSHGGGAQPASIDTSGKVAGGTALRVYGFDTPEAARAAGYVCEGGPAMSVSIITDAQIASGAWKAEGDPSATVIYTAPSGMPVEGGYAVPIYPVNGWGSAPAPAPPDPIGDTLRVDVAAYWKMNEANGTRSDSKNGYNLAESGGSIGSAAGHIGSTALEFQDSAVFKYLANTDPNIDMASGFSIWGWVYTSDFHTADETITIFTASTGAPNYRTIADVTSAKDGLTMILFDSTGPISNPITPEAWHFFALWGDAVTHYLQIDNGTIINSVTSSQVTVLREFDIMLGNGSNYIDYNRLQEMGFILRILTSDELTYLYNSGAGRALFPAP